MIIIEIAAVLLALFACYLYYIILIKPSQYAKNKAKQERKKRIEIDRIFDDNPITSAYRNN